MLRAILKLVAVGAVITLCSVASSIELYAASGGAVLLLPFAVVLIGPRRKPQKTEAAARKTLDVIPLPSPQFVHGATPMPMESTAMPMTVIHDDDIEGKTVRAPMTSEQAYAMHARYAPSFDQQVAIARYEARQPEPTAIPQQDPPAFDQQRYAAALQYAQAFESQLMKARRTAAYEVAPRRIARGSYTPLQYRAVRSDQLDSLAMSPSDWDEKTLLGVRPTKRGK